MIKSRTASARFSSGLLLLLFALLTLIQVGKVASATTTVRAGSISLYSGNTGSVPITVSDITAVSGLGAYELRVTFSPSVVEVLEVTGGTSPFSSVTANVDNAAGRVTFNGYQSGSTGPKGSITVAYLKVKAVGSAGSSSSLGVTVINLYDAEANPIAGVGVSGLVTIQAPNPSKSSSSISLSLDEDEVRVDGSVTVSGRISPAHVASVTLTFRRPDETMVSETARSGSDGAYAFVFEPDAAGAWKVSATWFGDSSHYGASSSTAKFLVTKLSSSVSMAASPEVLERNGTLHFEGSVSPERDGAIIKLEYRPHEEEWTELVEISTDSNGGFSYDWDTGLNASGQYEVRASWLGDHVFDGAESSPVVFYVAEDSALSLWLSSDSTGVDGAVVARGDISPLHSYVDVAVSVEAPNGTTVALTAKTDAAGNYKITFVPDTAGVWLFESSWPGDFNTHGSESPPVELQIVAAGSSIGLESGATSIMKGSLVTFSGKIEPSPGTDTVMLTLTRPDSSLVTLETESAADGTFLVNYAPDQAGVWLAEASWLGNSAYGGGTSQPVCFTVGKPSSALSLSMDPPIPKKGDLATLHGTLDPLILSPSVEVMISEDEGKTWGTIASPKTQPDGGYSASWRAEEMGTFWFQAVWEGDDEYGGCASQVIKLIVQEETLSIGVPLADGYETKVVSSTNSTVSTLGVDQGNGRIDANVEGPNGTTGFMIIFIPDGLLESYGSTIGDLVFSVDRTPVSPDVVEIAGGYLATIVYDHSSRTVSVHYVTHSVVIAVTDYEGQALADAEVYFVGTIETRGVTNGSGLVCLPSVPSGNYTLEVYYGGKVGGDSLALAEDRTLTVSTAVGEVKAEYSELLKEYADLQQKYQELQQNLAVTQATVCLSAIAFAAFTSAYFATKGQDRIHYVMRRFSDFWNDVSARLRPQRPRSRRRKKKDSASS